jgi:hypothetical protein
VTPARRSGASAIDAGRRDRVRQLVPARATRAPLGGRRGRRPVGDLALRERDQRVRGGCSPAVPPKIAACSGDHDDLVRVAAARLGAHVLGPPVANATTFSAASWNLIPSTVPV